jgi:hypothetical protein
VVVEENFIPRDQWVNADFSASMRYVHVLH